MTLLHCILTQGLSNLSNRFDRRLCVCMNLILPGETNVTELGRGKFVFMGFYASNPSTMGPTAPDFSDTYIHVHTM